jgi:glutaredoxin
MNGRSQLAPPVILYALPGCAGSRRAREYLSRHGVAFEEVNVLRQPRAVLHLLSGYLDHLPVIRVGERTLYGFDARTLGAALRVLPAGLPGPGGTTVAAQPRNAARPAHTRVEAVLRVALVVLGLGAPVRHADAGAAKLPELVIPDVVGVNSRFNRGHTVDPDGIAPAGIRHVADENVQCRQDLAWAWAGFRRAASRDPSSLATSFWKQRMARGSDRRRV